MSEPRQPAPDATEERFLRHLAGTADEAERQQLEQDVLEDDELFQRLSDLESELVDSYVEGALDEQTTRHLASLVSASPRLQAQAETTLALTTRTGKRPPMLPSTQPTDRAASSKPWRLVAFGSVALALALIAWLFIQLADQRTSLDALRTENIELRERSTELEEDVSRLEASNRSLTRRLARLEAGGTK
ncbi:MAG: hypothetical protein AAF560_22125 [Acidobacteriota bacterium]